MANFNTDVSLHNIKNKTGNINCKDCNISNIRQADDALRKLHEFGINKSSYKTVPRGLLQFIQNRKCSNNIS